MNAICTSKVVCVAHLAWSCRAMASAETPAVLGTPEERSVGGSERASEASERATDGAPRRGAESPTCSTRVEYVSHTYPNCTQKVNWPVTFLPQPNCRVTVWYVSNTSQILTKLSAKKHIGLSSWPVSQTVKYVSDMHVTVRSLSAYRPIVNWPVPGESPIMS